MSTLPKYTLEYNERRDTWDLRKDNTHSLIRSYETKEDATTGGILKRAVGKEGGSVKIQKENGRFQEERTYPHCRDPRRSRG